MKMSLQKVTYMPSRHQMHGPKVSRRLSETNVKNLSFCFVLFLLLFKVLLT